MITKLDDLFEGMKVKRIKNIKNNNTEGIIIAIFTVSWTIHVKYKNGNIGRFCNPSHFEIIGKKNPISPL